MVSFLMRALENGRRGERHVEWVYAGIAAQTIAMAALFGTAPLPEAHDPTATFRRGHWQLPSFWLNEYVWEVVLVVLRKKETRVVGSPFFYSTPPPPHWSVFG